MEGFVTKTTGKDYWVQASDNTTHLCTIKGNIRLKSIRSTNPIAIGDYVDFDDKNIIYNIKERKNYIIRKATNLSKQHHIIAANIDQIILLITTKNPETPLAFIDRFLITAEAYNIPVILMINKADLLTSTNDLQYIEALTRLYQNIGYTVLTISALNGIGTEELQKILNKKKTLISGNSGVGKSTLINRILGFEAAHTAQISASHQKGMHTTTFSKMYAISSDTYIIDTPGIKGFGLIQMSKADIGHFFKEIFAISPNCRFHNCTHTHEPDCAVIKAVKEQRIALSRYQNYMQIIDDLNEEKYR